MTRRARLVVLLVAFCILAGPAAASARTAQDGPDIDQLCAANPAACTVLPDANDPGMGSVADVVSDSSNTSAEAQKTLAAIKEFTPENSVESWAQAAAEGSVSILAKMQTWQDKVTRPAFDSDWWRQQYAIMFGLSLLLFAFMLIVVVAKIGGPEGSVSAAQLVRDSGLKLWFIPVLLSIGPVILAMLQGGAAELGKSFATASGGDTTSATDEFLTKMTAVGNGFDTFGGAILALLILLGILLFSVAVLIEVAVASWGLNLLGLVIPLALVMHLYPPWRRPLARVAGLMLGLMFAPAAVNFVYWAFWSTATNLTDGMDLFGISLYMLIGSFFLAIAPLLVMWLFPLVVPSVQLHDTSGLRGRTREFVEPRSLNRLAGHFRTKEALSAHAPMLHAPERAVPARSSWSSQSRDGGQRSVASPQPELGEAVGEASPVSTAHDPVGEQLGKKNSVEGFDPEPFDPPREGPA